jgi:hypothetical protein
MNLDTFGEHVCESESPCFHRTTVVHAEPGIRGSLLLVMGLPGCDPDGHPCLHQQ